MFENNSNNNCCPPIKCYYPKQKPTCKKFCVCQCYEYSITCKPCKPRCFPGPCTDCRKRLEKPFDRKDKFEKDEYDREAKFEKDGYDREKKYDHASDFEYGSEFEQGFEYNHGCEFDNDEWGMNYNDNQAY